MFVLYGPGPLSVHLFFLQNWSEGIRRQTSSSNCPGVVGGVVVGGVGGGGWVVGGGSSLVSFVLVSLFCCGLHLSSDHFASHLY